MRFIIVLFLFSFAACDIHSFERDKRQIIAKDEIGRQLRGFRNYSITHFKEDTLQTWTDSVIIHPIRYTLDFEYNDSIGTKQTKRGTVFFTPEGNAVLRTEIKDRALTEK